MALELEKQQSVRRRKRKRTKRGLSLNENVEVRSVEDGFQGSWHPGTIIACHRQGWDVKYEVRYDHVLNDDESGSVIERVCFSLSSDADFASSDQCNYRGIIRPAPSEFPFCKYGLPYGTCVDVLYQEAWWEGVIFDHEDGSDERKVLFPDLGDEMLASINKLRITQDWDEVNDTWRHRGTWFFLELIEEHEQKQYIPVSIKQLWYDLREKESFQKLGEWTSTVKALWKDLVLEAIDDNLKLVVNHLLQVIGIPDATQQQLEVAKSPNNVNTYPKVDLAEISGILPVDNTLKDDPLSHPSCPDVESTPDMPKFSCNDKAVVCMQPRALVVYSNMDGIPAVGAIIHDEGLSSSNSNKINGTSSGSMCIQTRWLPAGPDIVPEAEFCPDAVIQYAQIGGRKPRNALNVRKHLLQLKWKIDFMRDKDMNRLRYTSPDGKLYYSLCQVCQHLCKTDRGPASGDQQSSLCPSLGDSSSPIEQPPENWGPSYCFQADISSDSGVVAVEHEYCPNAIVEGLNPGSEENVRQKLKKADMAIRGKNHLAALGGVFGNLDDGQFSHKKPSSAIGKKEVQKLKNCSVESSCTSESKKHPEFHETNVQASKRSQRKRKDTSHVVSPSDAHNTNPNSRSGCRGLVESQSHKKHTNLVRVLRSSKRVQHVAVPDPSHHNPRTLLSWLIDNNTILPRTKVQYGSRKERKPVVEGRVTRDGIKCSCCGKVYTLIGFELHAKGKSCLSATRKCCKPAASIFLKDGRSLLDCQIQIMQDEKISCRKAKKSDSLKGSCLQDKNDHVCSVCHYGGELILCDQCPSSFHKRCLGMKYVPDGDWFCSSCCCKICGQTKLNTDIKDSTDGFLHCTQCEHKYHIMCLRNRLTDEWEHFPKQNWFCSEKCEGIFLGLQKLLGNPIPVGVDNLTWTLFKFRQSGNHNLDASDDETLAETYCKLRIALDVMHECFEPVQEPYTKRDLMKDVIFSIGSELNRLNFRGFYTILLEKNEELITVATIRIYGENVAEIPLIGTRFQYRRLGMCRMLMDVLEKKLIELGVKRLILPAVPSVLKTWTGSFGFSKMTDSERLQFVDYTFLDFQDTVMCQKLLMKMPFPQSSPAKEIQPLLLDDFYGSGKRINDDGSSPVSEVLHMEQIEDGGIMEQGLVDIVSGNINDGMRRPIHPLCVVNQPNHLEREQEPHSNKINKSSVEDSASKKESTVRDCGSTILEHEKRFSNGRDLKCYQRRKTIPHQNQVMFHSPPY